MLFYRRTRSSPPFVTTAIKEQKEEIMSKKIREALHRFSCKT
jgi:hypothetical protein